MAKKTSKSGKAPVAAATGQLYELEVALLSGPITEAFARKTGEVARTIRIRGDQTLEVLHDAIFDAFDRFDEHMYEFQIGGKRAMDPKARRYVLPMAMDDPFNESPPAGSVASTTIESLGLRKGQVFAYWFDFGDDWWHRITVSTIEESVPPGRYPTITSRTGDSPPQYPDWDEEGDEA